MESVILVTAFSLSVALTILLTPLLSALALRRGWVDVPDTHRKMHSRPIPPVGGVTIFVGFIGGLAYLTLFADQLSFELPKLPLLLILSLLAMVLTGLYDDIRGLGFKGKFLMQIIVAYVLLHTGYRVDVSHLPFIGDDPYVHALISIPLTLLWIVGTINAVNLIDGLDGLAGGVVLIAFVCLAAVFGLHGDVGLAVLALVVVGALVGFLAYNFSPASVFMGDAGSLFLGCLLAAYSLSGETHSDPFLALLIPVVALGFPLLDTGLSIIRRLARGSAIFAPDSDHIHHRLARRWPHWQAVLVLYAAAGLFGVSAIAMSIFAPIVGFAVFAITAGGCGAGLLLLGYIRLRDASESSEKEAGLEQSEPALEQVVATTGDGARDSADSRLIWNVVTARVDEEVKDLLARALAAESRAGARVSGQVIKPEERYDRNRMRSLVRGKGEEIKSAIEMLSRSSVVVAAEGLSVADLDGEAVVLDSLKGRYFGLNEVGARILSLMQEPRPVDELVELVSQEYDISRDRLERDVLAFLSKLESRSLVQVSDIVR